MQHRSFVAPFHRRGAGRTAAGVAMAALLAAVTGGGVGRTGAAHAQSAPASAASSEVSDARPYDDKLLRLSVVLGSVHYLRELCGGSDGQVWRERMRELIDLDKGSALRRVKLTKSFNNGYRSYKRTYPTCTGPAQATLAKFMAEGAELSDLLLRETQ